MNYHVLTSTDALAAAPWDQLAHRTPYLGSAWLRARSRIIKAPPRFILLDGDDGRPLASAPCYLCGPGASAGYAPARLLPPDSLPDAGGPGAPGDSAALAAFRAALAERAGAWEPSLVVASPARYGGVSVRDGLDDGAGLAARHALIDAVERQALADHARSIGWLYLVEGEDRMLEHALAERGYARLILDAECYMPIRWDRFDDYLAQFRTNYRGTVKHEMAALDAAGVVIELRGAEALGPELAALERQWRLKYGRTPPLEEIVADYDELRQHMAGSLRVFVATLDGRAIGFSVFLEEGGVWYSRFGGFDYTAGNIFLYFNLLFYHPIKVMIERNAVCARYSLKSYEAKRQRGCLVRHVLAFVKAPPDWPSMAAAVDAINTAQARRFAGIAAMRITREPEPSAPGAGRRP
jgi:predicted N-acyltransferase